MRYIIFFLLSHLFIQNSWADESQVTFVRTMDEFTQIFTREKNSHNFLISSSIERGKEVRKGTNGLRFISKNKKYNMNLAPGYRLSGEYKILLSPVKNNNLQAKLSFNVQVDGKYKSVPVKLNQKYFIIAEFVKGSWSDYLLGKEVILKNNNKKDLKPLQEFHKLLAKALLKKAREKLDDWYDYQEIKTMVSEISFIKAVAYWTVKDNQIFFTNPLSQSLAKIVIIEHAL